MITTPGASPGVTSCHKARRSHGPGRPGRRRPGPGRPGPGPATREGGHQQGRPAHPRASTRPVVIVTKLATAWRRAAIPAP
jgi:hypothetical protein